MKSIGFNWFRRAKIQLVTGAGTVDARVVQTVGPRPPSAAAAPVSSGARRKGRASKQSSTRWRSFVLRGTFVRKKFAQPRKAGLGWSVLRSVTFRFNRKTTQIGHFVINHCKHAAWQPAQSVQRVAQAVQSPAQGVRPHAQAVRTVAQSVRRAAQAGRCVAHGRRHAARAGRQLAPGVRAIARAGR